MSNGNSIVKTDQLTAAPGAVMQTSETASTAVAAQAAAMIQARYVIALKNPRDLDTVRERLLKECKRPGFARVARYKKPIGQGIVGPSIRFAEAAIRCMGNVVVETVTLFDDREKRIIQVNVTDLEANVPYTSSVTIDKTVERRKTQDGDEVLGQRKNAQGITVFIVAATEDQLLNKQNALISKAIRTNGLRLVPGDIVEECMWQVVETQENADAKDPDGAKLQIFDAFGNMGVTVAQLKKYLGHDGATLNPKELADLRAVYSAIKDGETTWKEVMTAKEPAKEKKSMGDVLGSKKEKPVEYTDAQRDQFIKDVEDHILDAKVSPKALAAELVAAGITIEEGFEMSEQPTATLAAVAAYVNAKAGATTVAEGAR
jgi:hypothetical protein